MTVESGDHNRNDSNYEHIFEQFPSEERERVKEIWNMSKHAGPRHPEIPGDEVEHVLSEVHKRIVAADGQADTTAVIFKWKWMLAAAVLLLALGIGFLFVPQTVTAPRGEITSVNLPDGSEVELNSGTEIQYNRLFSFSNRTVHLDGEAFFAVREGEHPFVINVNGSVVEVTGTKFNVRSRSDGSKIETEVTVSEGMVKFYPENRQERSVTISEGQLSRWTTELQKPTSPQSVLIDRMLGWREQKLVFNEKSLSYIFRELERRFDVDIKLESDQMRNETLTTIYSEPENVESILKDICSVKGLHYAKTANGYRVYK